MWCSHPAFEIQSRGASQSDLRLHAIISRRVACSVGHLGPGPMQLRRKCNSRTCQHAPQPQLGSHAAQPAADAVELTGRPAKSLAVCPSIRRTARKSATLIAPAVRCASLMNGFSPRRTGGVHLRERIRARPQWCGHEDERDANKENPTIHHTNSIQVQDKIRNGWRILRKVKTQSKRAGRCARHRVGKPRPRFRLPPCGSGCFVTHSHRARTDLPAVDCLPPNRLGCSGDANPTSMIRNHLTENGRGG